MIVDPFLIDIHTRTASLDGISAYLMVPKMA